MATTLGSQLMMHGFAERAGSATKTARYGSRVIPAAHVVMSRQPVFISDEQCPASAHVELERDGDRVAGLKVTCACGRVIVAECDYAPDGGH